MKFYEWTDDGGWIHLTNLDQVREFTIRDLPLNPPWVAYAVAMFVDGKEQLIRIPGVDEPTRETMFSSVWNFRTLLQDIPSRDNPTTYPPGLSPYQRPRNG